jgi:exopolysaccharide production protein ExoQ
LSLSTSARLEAGHIGTSPTGGATAPNRVETAFAACLLLAGGGLFLDVLPAQAYDAYWLIFLLTGVVFAWHVLTGHAVLVLLRLPLLMLVLGIAVASIGWSIAPDRTLRVGVALLGTTLVGVYIGYRFQGPALLRLLASALFLLLLINAAVAVAPISYGTEPFGRGYLPAAWKGAARHRNMLGAHAGLAVLLFTALLLLLPRWRLFGLAGGGLALLVLLMAQSMSSIAATTVGLAVMLAFWLGKTFKVPTLIVALALFCCATPLAWMATTMPGVFAELLGRDPTMTSRVDIWRDSYWIIMARPLSGHGLGAVWSGVETTAFPQLETLHWTPHAHNGYLQLASEIGVPATAFASLFFAVTMVVAARNYVSRPDAVTLMTTGTVSMAVILNFSESFLFAPYELVWMLFVALATAEVAKGR